MEPTAPPTNQPGSPDQSAVLPTPQPEIQVPIAQTPALTPEPGTTTPPENGGLLSKVKQAFNSGGAEPAPQATPEWQVNSGQPTVPDTQPGNVVQPPTQWAPPQQDIPAPASAPEAASIPGTVVQGEITQPPAQPWASSEPTVQPHTEPVLTAPTLSSDPVTAEPSPTDTVSSSDYQTAGNEALQRLSETKTDTEGSPLTKAEEEQLGELLKKAHPNIFKSDPTPEVAQAQETPPQPVIEPQPSPAPEPTLNPAVNPSTNPSV